MTRDIIVSRTCMVGPGGYFRPGVGPAGDDAVIVSIDFYRPEPDPEMDPSKFPSYSCDYEIKYGGEVIHAYKASGMDRIGALLQAMVYVASHFDNQYFNAIDDSSAIPYMPAIPPEWFKDMRTVGYLGQRMTPIEGRTPMAECRVIWALRDGTKTPGRIAITPPEPDPSPDVVGDTTWACWWYMDGMWPRPCKVRGDGSLQPLMLTLQMIGYELHAFVSRGGRVLAPDEPGAAGVLTMFRVLMRRPGEPPQADSVLDELDAEIAKLRDEIAELRDDPDVTT